MPPAFDSEEDLVNYIASKLGAIGHVGASAKLDRVKSVTVK
jgi:hypothetical protein